MSDEPTRGELQAEAFYRENHSGERAYRLYEFSTYRRTDRLERLADGTEPLTAVDVRALYDEYLHGSMDAGVAPTLCDFGNWLAAAGDYAACRPADVIW